jgi:hypothetical protein
MRKNGVKVVKEADHVDVIGEVAEDQEEGMVLTFLINKREVKIHKPQESVEEEVSQDHIEECMTKLMLNVILVKYLGIMLQKVEILGKMLRRKAIMLSIKMKFDPTLLLAYKGEEKEEKNER